MKDGEVAFEWFERADYPNIRQVMEDKHRLPASFEDWEKSAEAGEQALVNSRHIVVRTIIESHTFASWCRERDFKANAQSRLNTATSSTQVPRQKWKADRQPGSACISKRQAKLW